MTGNGSTYGDGAETGIGIAAPLSQLGFDERLEWGDRNGDGGTLGELAMGTQSQWIDEHRRGAAPTRRPGTGAKAAVKGAPERHGAARKSTAGTGTGAGTGAGATKAGNGRAHASGVDAAMPGGTGVRTGGARGVDPVVMGILSAEYDTADAYIRVLGRILRDMRTSRGLTLKEAAGSCAVSLSYLSEVERGSKAISPSALASVLTGFGVPLSELLARMAVTIRGEEMRVVKETARKHREAIREDIRNNPRKYQPMLRPRTK